MLEEDRAFARHGELPIAGGGTPGHRPVQEAHSPQQSGNRRQGCQPLSSRVMHRFSGRTGTLPANRGLLVPLGLIRRLAPASRNDAFHHAGSRQAFPDADLRVIVARSAVCRSGPTIAMQARDASQTSAFYLSDIKFCPLSCGKLSQEPLLRGSGSRTRPNSRCRDHSGFSFLPPDVDAGDR